MLTTIKFVSFRNRVNEISRAFVTFLPYILLPDIALIHVRRTGHSRVFYTAQIGHTGLCVFYEIYIPILHSKQ